MTAEPIACDQVEPVKHVENAVEWKTRRDEQAERALGSVTERREDSRERAVRDNALFDLSEEGIAVAGRLSQVLVVAVTKLFRE